jgi:integrase
MRTNPAKAVGRNRQPAARPVRVFTNAELDAIAAELSPMYAPLPGFAAATGLRPEEWAALERRDVDRKAGILSVRRTVSEVRYDDCERDGCKSPSGCKGHLAVVELAKTDRSRRQVPLSPQAVVSLDRLPPRLDVSLLFPSPQGELLHLDNFRYREWTPAIEASGVQTPARIYDLRSTFASNALAAGITAFELAKVMGNSVEMIERHYGTLLDGSAASVTSRLAAFEAEQERSADRAANEGA